MLKLLSVGAVASAAMLAATLLSPATAAQFSTGHFNFANGSGQIGRSHGGSAMGGSNFTTPRQRRWVCGPIVNYDGTPHCHWTR